jgi:hypothetical protein
MTLEESLKEMNELRKSIKLILRKAEIRANKLKKSADSLKKEIQARIIKGDTLGDRITDLVLVADYELNGQIENDLRDINKRMYGHSGQLALIVSRREESMGCSGFGYGNQELNRVLREQFDLGLLSGDSLQISFGMKDGRATHSVALPTEKYLNAWMGLSNYNFRENKGNMGSSYLSFLNFAQSLHRVLVDTSHFEAKEVRELEVIIGNQEVRRWGVANKEEKLIIQMMDKLGINTEILTGK